jgi:hypothetical protein
MLPTIVEDKIVFTSDYSPGKADIEWVFSSALGGSPSCRKISIPGAGVFVEELSGAKVVSRSLFDRSGRMITKREDPEGPLTVFSPYTGKRVVSIYSGQGDIALSPLRVSPTAPPLVDRILFSESGAALPLPIPAALTCVSGCNADRSQVDALGASIGSLRMLEYLIKYGFLYVSDDPDQADYWQQPAATLNRYSQEGLLQGDCDDLAFLCAQLAKQFGVDLPVACILSADAAHALNLLVKETSDGGYVAATICTYGIDDCGAIDSNQPRAKAAPTIEEALERVFTKYPGPIGRKRVSIPRYHGIPYIMLLSLSEAGEQKMINVPLVALVNPVLRDEIISIKGIEAALDRPRDEEHPWIKGTRELLNTPVIDRTQVNYLVALINAQFDVETIVSVANEVDLSRASETEKRELFKLLTKHAKYPYGSPQMFEASTNLVAQFQSPECLIELITSRLSALEELIRSQSQTPQRVDKIVINRYREALYKAVLWGLSHERIFDTHTARMAKSAALKLRGLDGRVAVIERLSKLCLLEGTPFNSERAVTYREILDSLQAPVGAYQHLAEFYADGFSFEEALRIYEAIIYNPEILLDRQDTKLKLALMSDISRPSPELVELRCRCSKALFERAELLNGGLDLQSFSQRIIIADLLLSTELLAESVAEFRSMSRSFERDAVSIIYLLEGLGYRDQAKSLGQDLELRKINTSFQQRRLKRLIRPGGILSSSRR